MATNTEEGMVAAKPVAEQQSDRVNGHEPWRATEQDPQRAHEQDPHRAHEQDPYRAKEQDPYRSCRKLPLPRHEDFLVVAWMTLGLFLYIHVTPNGKSMIKLQGPYPFYAPLAYITH